MHQPRGANAIMIGTLPRSSRARGVLFLRQLVSSATGSPR
ncbi:MAG: hypothetical protein OJF55_001187 [Rhodanobacteraceae bacterium]|nr:MAG: hypothetical protein OJF55_001187 [Rhodanobacteraceae bacterium]